MVVLVLEKVVRLEAIVVIVVTVVVFVEVRVKEQLLVVGIFVGVNIRTGD